MDAHHKSLSHMTETELKNLEILMEKATPGPWKVVEKETDDRLSIEAEATPYICFVDPCFDRDANAHSIIALRNAFPRIAEAVRKGDRMREALTALVNACGNDPCFFDHHGSCQAHFVSNPCEIMLARQALADDGKEEGK